MRVFTATATLVLAVLAATVPDTASAVWPLNWMCPYHQCMNCGGVPLAPQYSVAGLAPAVVTAPTMSYAATPMVTYAAAPTTSYAAAPAASYTYTAAPAVSYVSMPVASMSNANLYAPQYGASSYYQNAAQPALFNGDLSGLLTAINAAKSVCAIIQPCSSTSSSGASSDTALQQKLNDIEDFLGITNTNSGTTNSGATNQGASSGVSKGPFARVAVSGAQQQNLPAIILNLQQSQDKQTKVLSAILTELKKRDQKPGTSTVGAGGVTPPPPK